MRASGEGRVAELDALAVVRDEAHRKTSELIDLLRIRERDYRDGRERAEKAAAEAVATADAATAKVEAAAEKTERLQTEFRVATEKWAAREFELRAEVAALQRRLDATVPAADALKAENTALQKETAAARSDASDVERRLQETADRLSVAVKAREEAERHEGMFRRALYTYLQERSGPAGPNAPTPETLKMIQDLVGA